MGRDGEVKEVREGGVQGDRKKAQYKTLQPSLSLASPPPNT